MSGVTQLVTSGPLILALPVAAPFPAKPIPAKPAARMPSSPTADSQVVNWCRAPMARISCMIAAMTSRKKRITCSASTGLENSPTDFVDVGAVPYRL